MARLQLDREMEPHLRFQTPGRVVGEHLIFEYLEVLLLRLVLDPFHAQLLRLGETSLEQEEVVVVPNFNLTVHDEHELVNWLSLPLDYSQ